MRLADVVDGVVVNVILVDAYNIPDWCSDWPECQVAGPGWTYDGETFYPPAQP